MPRKGQSNNPNGRPTGSKNKRFYDAKGLLDKCVTEDDWKEIFNAMKVRAKTGDDKSAKILLEYRFGKPSQEVINIQTEPIQHEHTVNASPKLIALADKFADR